MQNRSRLPFPYRPEADAAAEVERALDPAPDWTELARRASPWVQAVRDHPPPFWAMETLLREYPLTSEDGKALMRLAEALLRVPDIETAIALTSDQLAHLQSGVTAPVPDSPLARLSAVALTLSHKLVSGSDGLVGRLGARAVVAAALRAVQLLGRQFVLGENLPAALARARARHAAQPALSFSFDMLGEGARTDQDAQRHLADYRAALTLLAQQRPATTIDQGDGISVKLSALHPRFEALQHERVMQELVPRVWALCEIAAAAGLHLTLDAEESERLELSLEVVEALMSRIAQACPDWQGFGLAIQACQTRALPLVAHVAGLARRYRVRLMCRLVKGAYWDAEIKRAQELGLPHYPVFTHKRHTDLAFLACAKAMLAAQDVIYPQFATHNAATIAALLQLADGHRFELGRLHGMGEGIYREVLRDPALRCRVYAPVGRHRDLLAYLVRRLLENGANSSFVHQLHDERIGIDDLLRPVPRQRPLPLPGDLFLPARRNSEGLDLAVPEVRDSLQQALEQLQLPEVGLMDGVAAEQGTDHATDHATEQATDQTIDRTIDAAMQRATAAFTHWGTTDVLVRARLLRRAADLLQERLPLFSAALVREGRKTWNDAVAEVREAIDFLRYYASAAESLMMPLALPGPTGESNTLQWRPRGTWACISPWNFPLAIFTGQVAAALVTGNTVLAKPAEQTPRIARMMVDLLHTAGIPDTALQLLAGDGEVGARLVAHPQVAGVAFTGSTRAAKAIQRTLAMKDGPIVPLIAETGGINAMLVDTTALPEQVVDAVIQSIYRSAGQRCSALRLLCVHAAIADPLLQMLGGAIAELRAGAPEDWRTDLGPVIDADAYARLRYQLDSLAAIRMSVGDDEQLDADPLDQDQRIDDLPGADHPGDGRPGGHHPGHNHPGEDCLIAPQLLQATRIADVREEIFGPVLQVVRWSGDPLQVIRQINALGYGLTLGIHTRIDSRAQILAAAARVGNVYVNRAMTGAVVGVQPFGGECLSGTGPKAGGPHYLPRFCSEQTLTINLSAAGGDVELMSS